MLALSQLADSLRPPKASQPASREANEMYNVLIPNRFHLPVQAGSRTQIFSRTKIPFLSLAILGVAWEHQPGRKTGWYLHQHSPPCTLPAQASILQKKGGASKQDAFCLLLN